MFSGYAFSCTHPRLSFFSVFVSEFSNFSKNFIMAAMRKVPKFDSEGLERFKKSLICSHCQKPLSPEAEIYKCAEDGCDYLRNDLSIFDKARAKCPHHHQHLKLDAKLTEFVGLIKVFNCSNMRNGCENESEANGWRDHEQICIYRDVFCPKIDCRAKFAFNGIMDHYQRTHPDLKIKDDVLEFKGTFEDLEKSVFILNCHGKPFFPQFRLHEDFLYVWVVGHGNEIEMKLFDVRK